MRKVPAPDGQPGASHYWCCRYGLAPFGGMVREKAPSLRYRGPSSVWRREGVLLPRFASFLKEDVINYP